MESPVAGHSNDSDVEPRAAEGGPSPAHGRGVSAQADGVRPLRLRFVSDYI